VTTYPRCVPVFYTSISSYFYAMLSLKYTDGLQGKKTYFLIFKPLKRVIIFSQRVCVRRAVFSLKIIRSLTFNWCMKAAQTIKRQQSQKALWLPYCLLCANIRNQVFVQKTWCRTLLSTQLHEAVPSNLPLKVMVII